MACCTYCHAVLIAMLQLLARGIPRLEGVNPTPIINNAMIIPSQNNIHSDRIVSKNPLDTTESYASFVAMISLILPV